MNRDILTVILSALYLLDLQPWFRIAIGRAKDFHLLE